MGKLDSACSPTHRAIDRDTLEKSDKIVHNAFTYTCQRLWARSVVHHGCYRTESSVERTKMKIPDELIRGVEDARRKEGKVMTSASERSLF